MRTLPPPATAGAVATLLHEAARSRQPLVFCGNGTKAGWQDAAAAMTMVSALGLQEGFAHYAGDLVATIPAGMTLAEANVRLAAAGQWLPLDPPFAERATIGGIVSTNDSGPRRLRYGAPRDLIVGIEVALADGRVVKAGGRVVKNVAGYDLSRLFCGSHGTLGVITSATFKLAPVLPFSCTVAAAFRNQAAALAAAQAIAHSFLTPSAVELEAPRPALLVRFETTRAAAEQMASTARLLIETSGGDPAMLIGEAEDAVWRRHDRLVSAALDADEALLKVSVVPSALTSVLDIASRHAGGCRWDAIGRATLGVLCARFKGSDRQLVEPIEAVRRGAVASGGHARMLHMSSTLRAQLPAPPAGPAAAMMLAIKRQFDPIGILPSVPDGR